MNYLEQYKLWLTESFTDDKTKEELRAIEENGSEIEDRFYKNLEFGTGGMRGVIGAGTNRMNIYTVARATQGFANYLIEEFKEDISVAIAYDSRHMSKEFSEKTAEVLASNGIKVFLYETLRSTPELSFAVRELNCKGGIVITASHNPPQYNGYKVYNQSGCQLLDDEAEKVIDKVLNVDFNNIKHADDASERINYIKSETEDKFIDIVNSLSISNDIDKDINIVFTPLHGTGNVPVRKILSNKGFKNVFVVKEQEKPDSEFSTVKFPNPEDIDAYALAVETAKKVDGDIILATDPDCDRVGMMVKDDTTGEFILLTGNQTGALLVNYILQIKNENSELPKNGAIINTVVTSDLGEKIACKYGIETLKTLTGFKYIGDLMDEIKNNNSNTFLCGFEESYGYLVGEHVRDKDAVSASMLIVEMVGYYKKRGKTVFEVLNNIYEEFGYHIEETSSFTLAGISGQSKISNVIEFFRESKPTNLSGLNIVKLFDFKVSLAYDFIKGDFENIDFPKSNVLKFCFENGSWFSIRPSGTEPKMKIYFSSCANTYEQAKLQLEKIKKDVTDIIDRMI